MRHNFKRNRIIKKTLISLIGVLLSVVVIGCLFYFFVLKPDKKELTAKEFYHKINKQVDDLAVLAETTDNVYTLYFIGDMTKDDFVKHTLTIQREYDLLYQKYKNIKSKYDITKCKHYKDYKHGIDAIDALYTNFDFIYKNSFDENGNVVNTSALSYTYLQIKQAVERNVDEVSKIDVREKIGELR